MRDFFRAFSLIVAVHALSGAAIAADVGRATSTNIGGTNFEGRKSYVQHCAACHGDDLQGGAGMPLVGMSFSMLWGGRTTADFSATISEKMPLNNAGSLSPAEYKNIVSYLLWANGVPASSKTMSGGGGTAAKLDVPAQLPGAPRYFAAATQNVPTDADLTTPANSDWLMYNRTYNGDRYAPLGQITPQNAAALAPKCIFQTGEVGSFQSSPIAYRGLLYVTTTRKTYALDAKTCRKVWENEYVPEGPEGLPVNRGVALYRGKLFRGTADAHLLAIDAATGATLWDVWVADAGKGYSIPAAPAVFGGKVFVGEGGADRGTTGHIHAFDAETGKHAWTFNVVPTGKEPGAETWGGGQPRGGGSSWTTLHVDPTTRQVYAPIGNPGSSLEGSVRPGRNLYTNSVIALHADSGKMQWYIQQVPHDVWDWDTAAAPLFFQASGKRRMAVASKDGWLYTYDVSSKALISHQEITSHLNIDQKPTPQEGVRVCPGILGGAEWYGPAFDPKSNTLFVGTVDWCATLIAQPGSANPFGGITRFDPVDAAKGWIRAFDSVTGQPKWTYQAETPVVAALTPTQGGVLFGGLMNGDVLAFESATGKELYRFNTGGAVAGGISSYEVEGKQYVAVVSGNSSKTLWSTKGAATVVIFGLP